MPFNPQTFRRQIVDAVTTAQAQRSDAFLHLVYSPELADPLELLENSQRDTGLLKPPHLDPEYEDVAFPRLVTLDCRRVAAYMLETDPARDDPLFEASITQAYDEVCRGETADIGVINDNPGPSESAVCGWIVSRQSAADLARRMAKHSHPLRLSDNYHRWLRWHNPVYLASLWPALSPAQQRALLGDALWLAHDLLGQLRTYEADLTGAVLGETELKFHPTEEQWARYDAAAMVAEIARNWRLQTEAEGDVPPGDAVERLQRRLLEARQLGLRREDRRLYAATLAQLPVGAERMPEWQALIDQVMRGEAKLRDGLAALPERFWNSSPVVDGHAAAEPSLKATT